MVEMRWLWASVGFLAGFFADRGATRRQPIQVSCVAPGGGYADLEPEPGFQLGRVLSVLACFCSSRACSSTALSGG